MITSGLPARSASAKAGTFKGGQTVLFVPGFVFLSSLTKNKEPRTMNQEPIINQA
jgi:hypothetical protein